MYSILVEQFEKFEIRNSELREVLYGIHPDHVGKLVIIQKIIHGLMVLITQKNTICLRHSFIILSTLRFIDNEQWKPITPKYSKHPKILI